MLQVWPKYRDSIVSSYINNNQTSEARETDARTFESLEGDKTLIMCLFWRPWRDLELKALLAAACGKGVSD